MPSKKDRRQLAKLAIRQCEHERDPGRDMHSCIDLKVPFDKMCAPCKARTQVEK